jgi:hypothetical protein
MLLLPNPLRLFSYTRDGGVSRAAKGADCKSAGLAFVGSSPTSPTRGRIFRKEVSGLRQDYGLKRV